LRALISSLRGCRAPEAIRWSNPKALLLAETGAGNRSILGNRSAVGDLDPLRKPLTTREEREKGSGEEQGFDMTLRLENDTAHASWQQA